MMPLGDFVDGGPGNDTVFSSVAGFNNFINVEVLIVNGQQVALPSNGNDLLVGSPLNDTIDGGADNDTINGGADADSITGGAGADLLTGGAGADQFVFNLPTEGTDTITDFVSGTDSIRISAAGFGGGLVAGPLPLTDFVIGVAAGDPSDRFIYDNATGTLRYDPDGTGATPAVIIAILTGPPALAASDIVIF